MDSDLSTANSKKRCNPEKETNPDCQADLFCSSFFYPIEVTRAVEAGSIPTVKHGVCCSNEESIKLPDDAVVGPVNVEE